MLDPNGIYYSYLRKSRKDLEAEQQGEGETLARHKRVLDDLAKKMGVTISREYREVVSGETIAARPQMLRLLNDIEVNRPAGVFVVEVERLARGNTRDQGLVSETFQYSNTLIITPSKIYNPNDEFDEEYFEFGLFMSRREYKTIRRRLRNGKYNTAKEGKWPWSKAPYGYERYKLPNQKGYSLKVIPQEAEVVRLIFSMYTNGTAETGNVPISATAIARTLDRLHIKPRISDHWVHNVIRDIILNSAYTGMVPAGKRKIVKVIENGSVRRSAPIDKNSESYPGIHEAIIDQETFDQAQKVFNSRSKTPVFLDGVIKNPLAGLLKCQQCGYTMIRRPARGRDKHDWYLCSHCHMPGAATDDVMNKLLVVLEEWLKDYRISISSPQPALSGMSLTQTKIAELETSLAGYRKQLNRAYEAFEIGVYDGDTLKERTETIKANIKKAESSLHDLKEQIKKQEAFEKRRLLLIPKVEYLLDHFARLSCGEQNSLLKEVLEKVEYSKDIKGTKREIPGFTLKIYPKI